MINIRTNRVKNSLKLHKAGLKEELVNRAEKRLRENKNSLPDVKYNGLLDFIRLNEEKILVGEIVVLKSLQEELFNQISDDDLLKNDLEYIFNYTWFRGYKKVKYDAFKLAKSLDISVCPYCNRNYTTSHRIESKNKNIFPEFDHYYPQSHYPLLALSFFNLIPSCNICNTHFKGSDNPDNHIIYYPYESFEAVKYFNFEFTPLDYESLIGKSKNFNTGINTIKYASSIRIRRIVKGTLEYFGIVDSYNANHKGLIEALINKRINHSESYIKSLTENYGISREQAFHILFESYYEDDKLMKRPFSKLKKDIFDEIESLS